MSYVPSDFDNLNEGVNILNIIENNTLLAQYEGIYEDKGVGIVQQYSLCGNLNLLFDERYSDLGIDFCYILKGNHPETYPAIPNPLENPIALTFDMYIPNQTSPVASYNLMQETYTVTEDSNNNKVLLFENVRLQNNLPISTFIENNQRFMVVFHDNYKTYSQDVGYISASDYVEICSFDTDGYNGTAQTQQPVYLKWINETTGTVTAQRIDGLDGQILVTFDGTFDNSFLGDTFNDITQISISYINPYTHEDIQYNLEKDVDFTVDTSTYYSGTGSSAEQIMVNLDELFPEGIELDLTIYTLLNYKTIDDTLGTKLPVFDWGKENGTQYLNVNGKYKLNDTDIITTSGNDNFLNINTRVTDNNFYNTNLDTIAKNTRYSTNETVIGTFIDGKPIYRRTFDGVFNNDQVLLTNVSSVVNSYGEGDPATGVWRQLPYFEWWNNASYTCAIRHDKNNNTVNVKSFNGGSASGCYLTITIEYTKTTD